MVDAVSIGHHENGREDLEAIETEEATSLLHTESPKPVEAPTKYVFPKLDYRPGIDGLRAVAVSAVVVFHFGLALPGGYVGVDVFFTISGYLISRIILQEMETDHLSIFKFWNRRLHRLQPALLCMMWIAGVAGWFMWTDRDMRRNNHEGVMALLSIANFEFYKQENYFETPESHMFLHCWSLAVEEQFYMAYPSVCWMVWKCLGKFYRDSHMAVFFFWLFWFVLSIASFAVCVYVFNADRNFGFYMLPARGWELLCGAFVAYPAVDNLRESLEGSSDASLGVFVNVLQILGLGMIVASMVTFDASTPFPSYTASLPCLGTAFALSADRLAAGEQQRHLILNNLLCSRPIVWLGKISYSLYLWHWPIFVILQETMHLTEDGDDTSLPTLRRIIGVVLSVVCAALSYYFVEDKFRRARFAEWKFWTGLLVTWVTLVLVLAFHDRYNEHLAAAAMAAGGDAGGVAEQNCWRGIKERVVEPDVPRLVAEAQGHCELKLTHPVSWERLSCRAIAESEVSGMQNRFNRYTFEDVPDWKRPWIFRPQGTTEPTPSLVTIGSSHCLQHMPIIHKLAQKHQRHMASLCANYGKVSFHGFSKDLSKVFDQQRMHFLSQWKPELLVWMDLWVHYHSLEKWTTWKESESRLMYEHTLRRLLQHVGHIIVIGEHPLVPWGKNLLSNVEKQYRRVHNIEFLKQLKEGPVDHRTRMGEHDRINAAIASIIKEADGSQPPIEFLPTDGFFLSDAEGHVMVVDDEVSQLLFYDKTHLTEIGASKLIPLWENYVFQRKCPVHTLI